MPEQKVHKAVAAALAALNAALSARDPAIVGHFHRSALFIGSEPGEMARGRTEIAALFARILGSPATVQFHWTSIETAQSGSTLWFFADGEVEIVAQGRETRRTYGLTGVLVKGRHGWRWRLFHGSEPWIAAEPVPAPA